MDKHSCFLKEVAVRAGFKVLMEIDYISALIVGDPKGFWANSSGLIKST
jgi:hypothetical protein